MFDLSRPRSPGGCSAGLKWLLVGGILMVFPVAYSAADDQLDVTRVLARARKAIAYDALQRKSVGVVLQGSAQFQGLAGDFRLQFAPRGEFIEQVKSRGNYLVAFDGSVGWGIDWSAVPRILEGDELGFPQTQVWVLSGRWLADDGPFSITLANPAASNGQVRLKLRLKAGGTESDLALDRTTWLPQSVRLQGILGEEKWEFERYESHGGLVLPHRLIRSFGGLVDRYEVQSVADAAAQDADSYAPELALPNDTQFDPSVPQRIELKRAPSGHLFVRPQVNGQDVGWFALDTGTGAGMTISPAVADRLQMPAFGKAVGGGAGQRMQFQFRQGTSFALAGVSFANTIYTELPGEFIDAMSKLFGFEWAGTVGYDLFGRAVVELDLHAPALTLYHPDRFQLARGRWEDLRLNRKIPCVRCQFEDGHEGIFQLDTGAGSVAIVHAPAVEKLHLLDNRQTTPTKLGGVGGSIDARLGKLLTFTVGGHRYTDVTTFFVVGTEGALTDSQTTGTFGGGVLGPCTVVFDYPHRRIAFVTKTP